MINSGISERKKIKSNAGSIRCNIAAADMHSEPVKFTADPCMSVSFPIVFLIHMHSSFRLSGGCRTLFRSGAVGKVNQRHERQILFLGNILN